MPKRETAKKCKLCKKRKATVIGLGHHVCATCQKIFTDVRKRNDLIDKARVLLGVITPKATNKELQMVEDELESGEKMLGDLATILNSNGSDLTDVARARMEGLDNLQEALMKREATIVTLQETVDDLRETLDKVDNTGLFEPSHDKELAGTLAMIKLLVGDVDPVGDTLSAKFVGKISAQAAELVMARQQAVAKVA